MLLGEVARERLLGFVEVVVGVKDRKVDLDCHELLSFETGDELNSAAGGAIPW